MPNPSDYDNEDDFMGACVPMMKREGADDKQAQAACINMWEKGKSIRYTIKAVSMDEHVSEVFDAFASQFPFPPDGGAEIQHWYVEAVYPKYAVICNKPNGYFEAKYETTPGGVIFDAVEKWKAVEKQTEWVPVAKSFEFVPTPERMTDDMVRVAVRNNAKDSKRIQTLHDLAVEHGASCKTEPSTDDIEELAVSMTELVAFGQSVKVLDNAGHVGGYLVRFTDESEPDLMGDYFTKETDFGEPDRLPVMYNHGFDTKIGKRRIGTAKVKQDEFGLWATTQLNMADQYEAYLLELAKAGKLGYSSGSAGHAIDKVPGKNANWIKQWFIAEASLTPQPAEPRNRVVPLKSLKPSVTGRAEALAIKDVPTKVSEKEYDMDKIELQAMLDAQKDAILADVESKATAAAKAAVKEFSDALPEIKNALNVQVVTDEADQPWKSKGEFFMAVKNAALRPADMDVRLKALKATGMNEAIPSQGGFLVPPSVAPGILEKVYDTGSLLAMFNRIPVEGNGMSFNLVDETSRADGSRFGGIQGYWGAEAGTKTASKPKFRQLELKLRKVYALCVATDELLEDASALEGWLTSTVPNELRFKIEDAIINGVGAFQPLGILNSPAFKSATRVNASQISATDIGNMWAARWVGAKDYVWLGNQSIFPQLLTMSIGNQPMFVGPGGLGGLPYGQLLGRPYLDTEYNPALGTLGDLMLVSPSQYVMIEKAGGIQFASSIHVYFTSDESAFRFVMRVDGAPTWTSTLTGKDGNTVSPFVGLAATT